MDEERARIVVSYDPADKDGPMWFIADEEYLQARIALLGYCYDRDPSHYNTFSKEELSRLASRLKEIRGTNGPDKIRNKE